MPGSIVRARRRLVGAAALVLVLLTAVGCSAGSPSSGQAHAPACTPSHGKVDLRYWTWGAGYEKVATLWNRKHPNIQVHFSSIPTGIFGGYQKMYNAAKAGTAPDIGFLEFDALPGFRAQGDLINIDRCLGKDYTDRVVPSIWNQVTLGEPDSVYGVPIGSGPMALFYRRDLFAAHHIAVPKTWQEYAAAAAKIHRIDPHAYITNFGDANWFAGIAAQNGAHWFDVKGAQWTVNVNDEPTRQAAALWQHMLDKHEISPMKTFSPEWNSALATGKLWTWTTATWGAGIIKTSAPKTAGRWGVVPLPSWGPGKPVSANWGGGALSVFTSCKHPYEAAEFAHWMATDHQALRILNDAIGIYPTTRQLLHDPLFTSPDPFFGNEKTFQVFQQATAGLATFRWGPDMTDTYTAIGDSFDPVVHGGDGDLVSALDKAQRRTVAAMRKQGVRIAH